MEICQLFYGSCLFLYVQICMYMDIQHSLLSWFVCNGLINAEMQKKDRLKSGEIQLLSHIGAKLKGHIEKMLSIHI